MILELFNNTFQLSTSSLCYWSKNMASWLCKIDFQNLEIDSVFDFLDEYLCIPASSSVEYSFLCSCISTSHLNSSFIPSFHSSFFLWSLFFTFSVYHELTKFNGGLRFVGWEEVWCIWQPASGYCPQPVGVQGTWSPASEVCFPPPSWRESPSPSLHHHGDSCEYHEESVRSNYLFNTFTGGTAFCIMPDLKACSWFISW